MLATTILLQPTEITQFICRQPLREASGNSLKESQIGAILARRDLLARMPEPDRHYVRWVPNIGRVPAYALTRKKFGREGKRAFAVHPGGRDD